MTDATTRRITTRYEIHGPVAVFICDQCIAGREDRLRRVVRWLGVVVMVSAVIFGVVALLTGIDRGLAIGLPAGLIIGGAVLALVRWPTDGRLIGEGFAIDLRRPTLREQGWEQFWTSNAYRALAAGATDQPDAPK
ncbi:MAG: hypothetical protein WD770_09120 [Actinomycetota bacterium]